MDRKALWIGRLYESEGSTDRWASGSDVGLVRNSPTPIAWFVEACFSPGCVDPVFHIPPGRHVPPSGGDNKNLTKSILGRSLGMAIFVNGFLPDRMKPNFSELVENMVLAC